MAKVLLVEDENDMRELMVQEIEDMGYEVVAAKNGEEAVHCAGRESPHVILSDINMPKMNGYEFRRELTSRHPHLRHLPFVFVSAYADEADIADGLIAGANHYITKPINFDVLRGLLADLSRGHRSR
ncbi:MAG: response regulator [Rhizobiales bacterium]|nr:response regulator [Hyphomicrobiales bacterium]